MRHDYRLRPVTNGVILYVTRNWPEEDDQPDEFEPVLPRISNNMFGQREYVFRNLNAAIRAIKDFEKEGESNG